MRLLKHKEQPNKTDVPFGRYKLTDESGYCKIRRLKSEQSAGFFAFCFQLSRSFAKKLSVGFPDGRLKRPRLNNDSGFPG